VPLRQRSIQAVICLGGKLMRKLILIIFRLALVGIPGSESYAAKRLTTRKPVFYINSGMAYTLEPSNLERFWKRGISVGAGVGVPINTRFTAVGYLNYNSLSFNNKGVRDPRTGELMAISGDHASILTISLNLKIKASESETRISPYFITGAGFFNISAGDITSEITQIGMLNLSDTDSESALNLTFGLGIDFKLSQKINLFAEGRGGVGTISANKVIYLPMKLGISFQGI